MKSYALLVLAILAPALLWAQNLNGFLWLSGTDSTGNPVVGYTDYLNTGNWVLVDTLRVTNWSTENNVSSVLAVADGNLYSSYQTGPTPVLNQVVATGDAVLVEKEAGGSETMYSVHSTAPYFRAYSETNGQLLTSLDTTLVRSQPHDFKVWNNRAYLLYGNHFEVVDIWFPSTVDSIHTPHPLQNQNFNTYFAMNAAHDRLLIQVDYATGAPRFSVLEVDLSNNAVHTVFHAEFMYNPTVLTMDDDAIYFGEYPSRYVLADDTIIYATGSQEYIFEAQATHDFATGFVGIDYDGTANSFLAPNYSDISTIARVGSSVSVLQGPVISGAWQPIIGSSVPKLNAGANLDVWPNPARNQLQIRSTSGSLHALTVLDVSGHRVRTPIALDGAKARLDITELAAGVYFLRATTNEGASLQRFVKQ